MVRRSLCLIILLSVPVALQAMPHGCSALAAEREWGSDLWIIEANQAPRLVLSAKRPIMAAAWSPDRREIAFGGSPPTASTATEVVIAEVSGRIVGRFKVDRSQGEGGLRYIEGIEWRGPRTLVTQGDQGPHGGYMDVWRLAKDHTGAERVRRAGLLGGSCAVSPSMQYVACAGEGAPIDIFDTLARPADEDGSVWDEDGFSIPSSGGPDDHSEGVESNFTWDSAGALYAVRLEKSRRVLTTVERNPAAPEGWSITDREIAGIDPDSHVVDIELDAHGGLMLSAAPMGTRDGSKAYYLPEATAMARAGGVVRVRAASLTELRRPRVLEAAVDGKTRTFKVLDSYCESSGSRQ